MHHIEFEVGQQYENRKGKYEVLAIEGDVMRIRWKAGEEVNTTVKMQNRILDNMKLELERLSDTDVPSPRKKSTSSQRHRGKRS